MCYLFLGLRPLRVKDLFLWLPLNFGIVSPVKLELQKQCNLSEKNKTFYFNQAVQPIYFVSWHAQLVTRNEIPTTILNTPLIFSRMSSGHRGVRRYWCFYIHSFIHSFIHFRCIMCGLYLFYVLCIQELEKKWFLSPEPNQTKMYIFHRPSHSIQHPRNIKSTPQSP